MTEIGNINKTMICSLGFSKVIQIQEVFVDKYLADTNGDYIKVYLMLLRYMNLGNICIEDIASKLDLTPRKIITAIKYWESVGVLNLSYSNSGAITNIDFVNDLEANNKSNKVKSIIKVENDIDIPKIEVADFSEISYDTEVINSLSEDKDFKYLISVYNAYNNKCINEKQIAVLIYLYRDLNFNKELIDYLLEFVCDLNIKNINYIAKVGKNWAINNITTVEQARETTVLYNKSYNKVLKHMGIDSKLTPKHIEIFDTWFGMLSEELVLKACDIAISQKGKASTSYVNKIITNWKEQNVKSLDDVERISNDYNSRKFNLKSKNQNSKSSFRNFPQRSTLINNEGTDDFLMYMTRDA